MTLSSKWLWCFGGCTLGLSFVTVMFSDPAVYEGNRMSDRTVSRRQFVRIAGCGAAVSLAAAGDAQAARVKARPKPNVVFVFADQWRAQAVGYAGDPNARTPHLDKLSASSVNFTNAVSGCPVCTPYRGSLLTGRFPLSTGLFLNDVYLRPEAVSLAEAYASAGYDTGYIGKWHIDGHGRSAFIPRSRRQGFDYWKVLECTHGYNRSAYYADKNVKLTWKGYDAIAQTRDAARYIRDHAAGKPFLLVLSWGPPHNPYGTAPARFRGMFPDPAAIKLRPNVPARSRRGARRDLQGYYAHCAALDECVGDLLATLDGCGIADDTIFVFTSDHGDMLGSQGMNRKQKPWDESIMVPFLLRYPAVLGRAGKKIDMPVNTPDIMPTLLALSGAAVPETVEGRDYSAVLKGTARADNKAVLISCPAPFAEWHHGRGGREYRGVRTRRYTYVRDLKGPWLLYDNQSDPYQMKNLVGRAEHADVQAGLEALLAGKLKATGDTFAPAATYIKKWGYKTDANGTVPYTS